MALMNTMMAKMKRGFAKAFPTFAKTNVVTDGRGGAPLQKPFLLHFGINDQIMFAKRLSMILQSGMPLLQGLVMLGSQTTSRSAAYVLKSLTAHVEQGLSLSSGLEKFKDIFGNFCINIIRVGETSGTLHDNFNYLAEELKKKNILRKKVIGALIYPAIIVSATIGISLVLTVYIFPKITPIFQSFKADLPFSTRILIALSNFLIDYGLWVFIGFVASLIGIFFLMKVRTVRYTIDRAILKVPLFGKLAQYYNLANMTRTMSLLLKSDVRLIQAFTIVSASMNNLAYRTTLENITTEISKGQRISTELEKYPEFFPPMATQMLVVGEQTGNLSGSLMYLSNMYEEEIDDLTKNLTNMIEPVLMVVMGVIVGFIAVSIITPIYGITQTLSNYR